MDDLISEFLTETGESLDVIDTELVRFENNPEDRAILDNIFRLLHTVKGTCGFLGLPRLEAVAHAGETLLGKFRDGDLAVTPPMVTLVLQSIDQIKLVLKSIEETGAEPAGHDRELISRLEDASQGRVAEQASTLTAIPDGWDADLGRELRPGEVSLAALETAFRTTPVDGEAAAASARIRHIGVGEYDPDLGRELRPGEVSVAELEAAFNATEVEAGHEIPDPQSANAEPPEAASAVPAGFRRADDPVLGSDGAPRMQQTVRVAVDVLDALMTTVSELVLTRNQLMQTVRGLEDDDLKVPLQRLSAVTGELQDGVMKTRMQPIGDAWRKLPRIIRDVSGELGKKIDLVMEGSDTELDRQVLELIKDPLTHMVRNSVDHGLEMPADRIAAGKPEKGVITVKAFHEGGHIIISIADDGMGLNTARISEKALDRGLTTQDELDRMTEAQIHRFIFAPGFSTAAQVTNLSGRGVGMDVVRNNIEQIGGIVDVTSKTGKGSHFKIKIPLTLAIVSALIIGSREQRFAIPQLSVRELLRVGAGSEHVVESLSGARVMRLRDRLMPLVDLQEVLGVRPDEDAGQPEAGFVVVLDVGGRNVGLIVDNVLDTEEIVVKPLSDSLRGVGAYSGATILGDGTVIMILDPNGLAGDIMAGMEDEENYAAGSAVAVEAPNTQRLLLVRAGGTEPKAVPLALVTRLEEFGPDALETTNGRLVVQYRGRLMPIVPLGGQVGVRDGQRQPVLVFSEGHGAIGLAVDHIVDVVEERVDLQMRSDKPGIIGSAIIRGKATDVVDVAWHIEQAQAGNIQRRITKSRRRVLLVDADAFARRMIAPLLAAAGYDVTPTGGMHEVVAIAEAGEKFDALVGDPVALEKIRAQGLWANVPALAVTDWPEDTRTEGLTTVLPRSDRGALIAALDEVSHAEKVA